MRASPRRPLSLSLSLLLVGLACEGSPAPQPIARDTKVEQPPATPPSEKQSDAKPDAAPDTAADPKPETPVPPTPAFTPPTRPAGPAGPAYFALDDRGIVRLDDGKFTLLANSPTTLIKGLQLGGDGAVWVVGFQDVLRLDGDKFKKITEAGYSEIGGSIDAFTVTDKGELWAATFKGVSHFANRAWTTEEKAKIGAGDDLLAGIVVDKAGRVWVLSTHKLHLLENGAWRDIDLSAGGIPSLLFFESLALAPDDSVYALASTALLHVSPAGVATKVALGGRSIASYGRLMVASGGGLAARDGDSAIGWPAGGEPRVYESRDGKDFKADNIKAVAADDSGRLWVSSELGVAILGPGDAKVEWPSGTVPELVGEVEAILVLGSGPAKLPGAGPQRKGGLTGKVLSNGTPQANTPVELCPSPDMMFSDSPCADSAVKFAVTTDDKGVWTVPELPLGTYGIAVKLGDKWQITLGDRVGKGMQEGKVYDTGSLALDRK